MQTDDVRQLHKQYASQHDRILSSLTEELRQTKSRLHVHELESREAWGAFWHH